MTTLAPLAPPAVPFVQQSGDSTPSVEFVVPGSGDAQPAEATASTQAAGPGDGGQRAPEEGGIIPFWVMLVLLFAFLWFFVIRPESKRQKERRSFQSSLQKGDAVVTAGGIHGVIAALDERTVTLKVGDGMRMKFDRIAIVRRADEPATEKKA